MDFDVIVVGSGAAGLAAAVEAAAAGASVVVVESESNTGGSSRLSGCWIQAAGTRLQRAAGIEDSPAAMLQDYLSVNRWRVPVSLARTFCEQAPAVVEWLLQIGLQFGPVVHAGAEPEPRGHRAIGEGEALIAVLEQACRRRDVEFALGNRVEEIIVERGWVVGVQPRGEVLSAPAVILVTGGFARNRALLDQLIAGPWLGPEARPAPTLAGNGSRGDAIALGRRHGATIEGQGRALWVPQALTPPAVLLVTPDGRRFVNESADFTTVAIAAAEFGDIHYAIFDERGRQSPRFAAIERTAAGFLFNDDAPRLDQPPLDEWVAAGDLVTADSVGGVAQLLGLDRPTVEASVRAYNAASAAGTDGRFEKPAESLLTITAPPFFGLRIRPTVLIATFCGLRIDEQSRVLTADDEPIPGLFAAGEATGGVVGDVYAGHGNSITSGLVFGRIAGRSAAGMTPNGKGV